MVWHLHMLDTHVGSMGIGGVDYLSGVKKTFLAIFGYFGMNMQSILTEWQTQGPAN